MLEKLTIWLTFTVVVSLLPIIADYLAKYLTDQKPTLSNLLSDSQLLLIAVALGAETMGEVISLGKDFSLLELLIISSGFLLMLFSALVYPIVTNRKAELEKLIQPQSPSSQSSTQATRQKISVFVYIVVYAPSFLLVLSLLASAFCKGLDPKT